MTVNDKTVEFDKKTFDELRANLDFLTNKVITVSVILDEASKSMRRIYALMDSASLASRKASKK